MVRSKYVGLGAALGLTILAAGLAVTHAPGSARAAAAAMSPLDRLVAEDEMRQKLALYAMDADGDGAQPKNIRELADVTLTPDVVSDLYFPNGALQGHSVGRDAIVTGTAPANPASPIAGRHFLVSVYFDEVTPTTAKSRTTSVHFDITKNMLGADCKKAGEGACGGRVVDAMTVVYHSSWVKTKDGWQMANNVIRRDD
jgi:hypothetical protein